MDEVAAALDRPATVVLDLSASTELDVQSADAIGELAHQLQADGVALRLAAVRAPALEVLRRAGVTPGVLAFPAIDDAVSPSAR